MKVASPQIWFFIDTDVSLSKCWVGSKFKFGSPLRHDVKSPWSVLTDVCRVNVKGSLPSGLPPASIEAFWKCCFEMKPTGTCWLSIIGIKRSAKHPPKHKLETGRHSAASTFKTTDCFSFSSFEINSTRYWPAESTVGGRLLPLRLDPPRLKLLEGRPTGTETE